MSDIPFYGGPEEGGWGGYDTEVIAYQECVSEEEAEGYKSAIEELAKEMERESKERYGRQCLREMEFLDARGLDANFLPEPNGPESYYVIVCQELPTPVRGERSYS